MENQRYNLNCLIRKILAKNQIPGPNTIMGYEFNREIEEEIGGTESDTIGLVTVAEVGSNQIRMAKLGKPINQLVK